MNIKYINSHKKFEFSKEVVIVLTQHILELENEIGYDEDSQVLKMLKNVIETTDKFDKGEIEMTVKLPKIHYEE